METKAFLYETFSGQVFRCMFAGLDKEGHAQWIIITPGEESLTLDEYREKHGLPQMDFVMLCMEGEQASSRELAKVLGCVLKEASDLESDLKGTIRLLRNFGVTWDDDPMELKVRIFSNENTLRKGKYSFWIDEVSKGQNYLFSLDNFDDLDTLHHWLYTFVNIMEDNACVWVDGLDIDDQTKETDKQ